MRILRTPKAWAVTSVIVAIALTIAYVTAFRHTAAASAEHDVVSIQPAAKPVTVFRATRRNLTRTLELTSELTPYAVAKLYAKESGYLRSIDVDYGSKVSAGETLAQLELPEQEAAVERYRSALQYAQLQYDRILSVDRETPGLLAQADVDKARADYQMALDQLDQAQSVLDYGTIVAPFDGIVTKRYVDPGALIQQGTSSDTQAEPIVEIADNYRLRLVIETPESVVPDIYIGMPVTVKIQATGETIPDRVARFSYDVHEDTRTMHTEVDVDNGNLHLKPGMYASVDLALAHRDGVVALPTAAISTDSSDVLVVGSDDTLQERRVTLGLQTPNWVEVTSGLRPGEEVYYGDRNAVTVGMKVRPEVGLPSTNGM